MSASVRLPEAPTARAAAPDEAWIGLGSNLGDRRSTIERALAGLGELVVAVSPLLETEPWGVRSQPWFLNAVARVRWDGGSEALLHRLLALEEELGRVRRERNGPRLIDLDLLLHGRRILSRPGLSLPHPGIASRRSVLEPWAATAPNLLVPGLECTTEQLRRAASDLPGQAVRVPELQASRGADSSPVGPNPR